MPYIFMFSAFLLLIGVFSAPVMADNPIESKSYKPGEMVLLDEGKAGKFVDSLDDLAQIRAQMGDQGQNDPLRIKPAILTEQNYAPYRTAVKAMSEESPDDYATIKALAEKYGFTSAEDWAETADGVLLTFFYIQQEKEGRTIEDKMREQLTPEMMAKIPASHKHMVDNALKMANKINQVPEENEQIVRGLLPKLEVAMSKNL